MRVATINGLPAWITHGQHAALATLEARCTEFGVPEGKAGGLAGNLHGALQRR